MQWGDRWLDDNDGPVELRHRDCGKRVGVQLRCAADHLVEADQLELAVPRHPRREAPVRRQIETG
jgi:hypothetical protein